MLLRVLVQWYTLVHRVANYLCHLTHLLDLDRTGCPRGSLMNRKIFSLFTLMLLTLSAVPFSFAGTGPRKPAARKQVDPLVAKLPASDAVAVIDSRRFFDEVLPKLLAAQQGLLGKINGHLTEFQTKTGIDARKFDRLVIGANIKREAVKDFDVDFVVLARGSMNAGSLIAGAKLSSNAGYREETLAGHTIYIFTPKSVADKTTSDAVAAVAAKVPAELAVTAYDATTLAIGSPARVRETLEAKGGVDAELTTLLVQRANPVVAFASRVPEGARNLLPMDNDELGKNIDSIRFLYGWANVGAGKTSMNLTARTATPENAKGLYDTVDFLKTLGKGLLGNSKKPANAVYARMIDSAKLSNNGSEVAIDLSVAQSDLDLLLGVLNKNQK